MFLSIAGLQLIFFWKLNHNGINIVDHLQHCMPYMFPAYLFIHYIFAWQFWNNILEAFGWSSAHSNNIYDILSSLRVRHPFFSCKKIIWLAILRLTFRIYGACVVGISFGFCFLLYFLLHCIVHVYLLV